MSDIGLTHVALPVSDLERFRGEAEVEGLVHLRTRSRPGMTGLWQVSARRSGSFDTWAQLDLSYIDRWSLWLDLKILARTLPARHGPVAFELDRLSEAFAEPSPPQVVEVDVHSGGHHHLLAGSPVHEPGEADLSIIRPEDEPEGLVLEDVFVPNGSPLSRRLTCSPAGVRSQRISRFCFSPGSNE